MTPIEARALVEALPTVVLGGAGLVMFGMVAATGVRILSRVDFASNRHNLFIVAISLGLGMIPMIAGDFDQWLPRGTRVLTHSGILLAAVFAVLGVLPLVVLAQLGTVICVGVLLDTLLVRTVLVPAIAWLMGERFWWPRKV